MQPDHQAASSSAMGTVARIARKELAVFFASPIAYLFLGAFAAVTLFVFFWVETFFARNIADVRPLFEWMPVLLIFLSSALTMRLWSEERRSGTLEYVFTQPVPLWHFVLGKFISCLVLLLLALVITLPLPITVFLLGDLEWGPVWAGYVATLLLGATYLSIGLLISARTDNQIVSLIVATAVCGLLYGIGQPLITNLVSLPAGELLRSLGTGSRFESITRGVLDVRDLYYYLSLTAVFLLLNVASLARERWARQRHVGVAPNAALVRQHRGSVAWVALIVVNVLLVNVWLSQTSAARLDVTRGQQYTLSSMTKDYLANLEEPVLLRAYFSGQVHPLLAPLVPQLRDLLREYEVAGQGRVRLEIIDPQQQPELEALAVEQYGMRPVPFQTIDRYQTSVVNAYFNVVVQYGDQWEMLNFLDLIEMREQGDDLSVRLRNPEFDITRSLRKVVLAWQGQPRTVTLYAPDAPASLANAGLTGPQFQQLQRFLANEASVQFADLASGTVPEDTDVLMVLAPESVPDNVVQAVDRFLTSGGTVFVASSPFAIDLGGSELMLRPVDSGLQDWLQHHGVHISEQVVLDEQNIPLPIPMMRTVGGRTVQDIRVMDYPYLIDVRGAGINRAHPMMVSLEQATVPWASPVWAEPTDTVAVTSLLQSSARAWQSDQLRAMPDSPASGTRPASFSTPTDRSAETLAVLLEGQFRPFDTTADAADGSDSMASGRLLVFGSNDLWRDQALQLAGAVQRSEYRHTLELAASIVDWSLEDAQLLSIRGRTPFGRNLPALDNDTQRVWETLNYGLAALALILIVVVQHSLARRRQRRLARAFAPDSKEN